jgi:hypothetical protein
MRVDKGTILVLFLVMAGMAGAAFSPSSPWHPIQQISGDYGTTSVDADQNGMIDTAENAYNAENASSCTSDNMCEATNIYVEQNVTIDGEFQANNVHVEENVTLDGEVRAGTTRITGSLMEADSTRGNTQVCIAGDCRSSWPTGGVTITCNWVGEKYTSHGYDGAFAWADGFYITCSGGVVTQIRYSSYIGDYCPGGGGCTA